MNGKRYFSLIFAVVALPFLLLVSRNVAVPLRFEDALIVLRYARNLATGHGFVFNPGERVLGVTTPLHTLISALWVLLSPEHAAAIQNVAGAVCLVLEAWLAARIVRRAYPPLLAGLVAILIVTNLNFNYLYFGMETHLFALLVLLAFHLFTLRRDTPTGVVLGLAFLTRYDAALLALLIGLALWAERRRLPVALTAAFFAVVTPWLAFALVYFHSILPSPLGAKTDFYPALGYVREVFRYYQDYFAAVAGVYTATGAVKKAAAWLFPLLCLAGTWRLVKAARDWLVLIAFAALQVLVYAALGPDPAFRWHYYLLNPVLTVLFAVGLYELLALALRAGSRGGRTWAEPTGRKVLQVATAVAVLLALAHLHRALDYRFRLDPHSRQLYAIAGWLNDNYDDSTSLLQPSIGILGYETNLRMIDHAGLVTPGLYYYDSSNHTPMSEVLSRFAPDLVLIPEGEDQGLHGYGYVAVKRFDEPHVYLLYERQDT